MLCAVNFRTMDFIQRVTGKRKDNDEFVTGSLMYDYDQDCWRFKELNNQLKIKQQWNTKI